MCEELNHSYSSLLLFIWWLWFDGNRCWLAHATDWVAFHSHYNTIIIYYVCHNLQSNIPTVEYGESGLHRSSQNGTYITENKCCLHSAWQTKEKHMQRNMIMLISCQGLCVWASYVNYTTGCICTAWVLRDQFQLMALLKSTSWLWNIWKSLHGLLHPESRE